MSKIAKSLIELIGNTPLLELTNFEKQENLDATLLAKVEYFNPLGSIKDRVAYAMVEEGIKEGKIDKDTVLIEPTSGNTGIGLAFVAAVKGLRLILTMPDTMSVERQRIVAALGAEVVLTPGQEGMAGSIRKAEELKEEYGNAFIPQQFENKANPKIHMETTAEEIWKDTDGAIDILVAGVGTGGTLTGTGKALKAKNPNIQVVAVEPDTSAVLSGEPAGAHKLQGIGAGFIPKVMDTSIVDEIIKIGGEEAMDTSRKIAKSDGVLVGISAGAAVCAAVKLAKRDENKGKNIVIILPDSGERYLSTELFANCIG
ncbi:cysteine synthase A [Velocimicrobium porci]|uniref:cysteine synthase n=1 Tax=Velocimicrobium porci TaxID=2606634 RepID=A0A6L5XUC4_9FIRM|nr:cysteine synthase A [Velocimicrobium porci]MSS62396.1 cysteine synthase A [Velocimicrobium porci]